VPIKNTDRVLHFLPIATGAYGTGVGTPGVPVGSNQPIPVKKFDATSPDFQSTLYKDPSTGKYTVAIAGSNNGGDWTGANVALSVMRGTNKWTMR
jgi:hypothetical protein